MSSSFAPSQPDAFLSSGASANTSSGLSSALSRGLSPSIQQWTCPCLNIRLSIAPGSSSAAVNSNRSPWLAELSSDNAIQVEFPSLTSRETVSVAENTNIACAKCLNCNTVVYAASKPAPPGPNRALGFNTSSSTAAGVANDALKEAAGTVSPTRSRQFSSPSRDSASKTERNSSRSNEPLVRPLDRKVWILPDALSPQQATSVAGSDAFSPAFNVLVPRSSAVSRNAQAEDAFRNAANAAHADALRDATPTRPAGGVGNRQASYGSGAGTAAYTLPAVPQHLVSSPPASPRTSAPSSTAAATPTSPAPSGIVSGAQGSSANPILAANPLATQLDSVAIERLKDMRSKAEAEVFELVRQKRREMEQLEKRFREEAESLLAVTKAPRQSKTSTANGSTASLIEQALKDQQRQAEQQQQQRSLTPQPGGSFAGGIQRAAPTSSNMQATNNTKSTGSAAPREINTAQSSVSSTGRRDSLYDEYSDLPPSAFERRQTYAATGNSTANSNGGAPAAVASSLGGLSASFAMRGRELPTQMQDWAEKRRLRERYPQGDHSALPSAANSNATSAANSIVDSEEDAWLAQAGARAQDRQRTRESSVNTESDAEMDRRGRGRQPSRTRGSSSSREPRPAQAQQQQSSQLVNADARLTRTQSAEVREETGRGRVGRSAAFNPPPAMSSSLLTKRPALAYVDDGRDADENTPSVGGKLISPQSVAEPSAQ